MGGDDAQQEKIPPHYVWSITRFSSFCVHMCYWLARAFLPIVTLRSDMSLKRTLGFLNGLSVFAFSTDEILADLTCEEQNSIPGL
jgi:hypothetical protein